MAGVRLPAFFFERRSWQRCHKSSWCCFNLNTFWEKKKNQKCILCILRSEKKEEHTMLPANLLFDYSKWIFNCLPIHNIWQAWLCFSPASTLTLKLLEAERCLLNTLLYFFFQPLSVSGSPCKASLCAARKRSVSGVRPAVPPKCPPPHLPPLEISPFQYVRQHINLPSNQAVDFNGPKHTSGCFQPGSDLWPKYSIRCKLASLQPEICNLLFMWAGDMETQ